MKFCSSCVMPDTKPGVWLDGHGHCNACRNKKVKAEIDWGCSIQRIEGDC
jgi:hypothetical protein